MPLKTSGKILFGSIIGVIVLVIVITVVAVIMVSKKDSSTSSVLFGFASPTKSKYFNNFAWIPKQTCDTLSGTVTKKYNDTSSWSDCQLSLAKKGKGVFGVSAYPGTCKQDQQNGKYMKIANMSQTDCATLGGAYSNGGCFASIGDCGPQSYFAPKGKCPEGTIPMSITSFDPPITQSLCEEVGAVWADGACLVDLCYTQ